YDEAEPLYIKTLEIRKRVLGEEHPDTLFSIYNIGELLTIVGRYEEAEALAVECYEGNVNRYGTEHSETIDAINLLIDLYTAWHKAEPDKGYGAKADQWRAKLPQPDEEAPGASPEADSESGADDDDG
ncbi:MAG: tetratricopeptide repeat protein, partial [Phycisphaerales bacterium]|nr:tetratricopeptide repeat protein [Phycisphaerales bacterium]